MEASILCDATNVKKPRGRPLGSKKIITEEERLKKLEKKREYQKEYRKKHSSPEDKQYVSQQVLISIYKKKCNNDPELMFKKLQELEERKEKTSKLIQIALLNAIRKETKN